MKKIFTLLTLTFIFVVGNVWGQNSLMAPKSEPFQPDLSKSVYTRADENLPMTDVIFNPEGKKVPYTKTIKGLDWGSPFEHEMAVTVVFGENNKVYICNLLGRELSLAYDTYMEGEIIGDEIHVPVPQTIRSYGNWGQDVGIMEKGDNGEYYVSDIPYITYSYDKTSGEIKSKLPGEDKQYIIALIWTFGDWNEIGDFTQVYTPLGIDYNTMPQGIVTEEYYLNDNYYGYPVEIGFLDDKIYIKGLYLENPDIVVIGDIDGDIVKISQNQLVASIRGDFIWTKIILRDPAKELVLAPEEDTYNMYFDKEKKCFSSVNPDEIFAFNGQLDRVFYYEFFEDFTLKMQDSFAGIPSNPFWLSFNGDDYRQTYGIFGFNFSLTNISTEGNVLDINDLYYSIFIDGDILEFEEYEGLYNTVYPGIKGVMTQIPYEFTNGYDIDYTSIIGRFIGIYPDGVTTLGVQAIYKYNDIETRSDIMTLNVETNEVSSESGITSIIFDEEDVIKTEYYGLDGKQVSNPANGLYIKRYILRNGKTVTRKILIK